MNAPVKILSGKALAGAIEVLEIRAQIRAYLEYEHQFEHLADAVDPLQESAEVSGLVDAIGQDEVQRLISAPFARFRAIVAKEIEAEERALLEAEPADLTAYDLAEITRRVERWEAEDAKRPRKPPANSSPCSRPVTQSTVNAFKYVVGLGDPDRLASWLRNHSDVAPALLKEVANAERV